MKKIIFGITGLTIGGAERVLIDISNRLVNDYDYDITIFTLYSKGELEKELDKKVKLIQLFDFKYNEVSKKEKLKAVFKVFFGKKKIYRKYIECGKYDVEISFLEGAITRIFSTKFREKVLNKKKPKKIAWIHNDMSRVFGKSFKSKIKRIIDRNAYEKYDTLVFVSMDNMDKFNRINDDMDLPHERVVYNYIDKNRIKKLAKERFDNPFKKDEMNFVQVSRLVEQKGIDRIIRAHKNVIDGGFYHRIFIIGDGPERGKLEKLIKEQGVEKTFILLGQKVNPYPYIKNADYFCLFSKFEGYGMVIDEAKILNKFVLITDTAARESILDYHEYSKTAENSQEGIERMLRDAIKNKQTYLGKKINYEYDDKRLIEKVVRQIEKVEEEKKL